MSLLKYLPSDSHPSAFIHPLSKQDYNKSPPGYSTTYSQVAHFHYSGMCKQRGREKEGKTASTLAKMPQ